MSGKPINDVLAENLAHFMLKRGLSQQALAGKCGIGQTTISLYLDPSRRKPGAMGKIPSAKLSEVEMLAISLGVNVWELLRSFTPEEREAYEHIERAFKVLHPPAQAAEATTNRPGKLAA